MDLPNVRFGSEADICGAKGHVRFAPNNDRESGFPQTVMSALPPKADVCGANRHVCFGPEADIAAYSITSSTRASNAGDTTRTLDKAAPPERCAALPNYPIAFLTRSSVNGAWRNRLPVRAMTAFDTAGVISGVAI